MTRHHLSLWLLLAAAFACFAALSAGDMPTVCGHTLKSSDIVPTLFSARSTDNAISTGGPTACPAADSTIEEVQFPVPVDTAAQTILFIGDSMLEGLGPRLAAYASHNGHTLYNVVWYSSTSEVWGRSDKLQSYIRRLHPTYVIVCLGANELFVPRIAERRREYVEKIIADIDTLPYLCLLRRGRFVFPQRRHAVPAQQRRRPPDALVGCTMDGQRNPLDARAQQPPHTHGNARRDFGEAGAGVRAPARRTIAWLH